MHLEKFVHTETGKVIMSVLLGFGLASLFRKVCKDKQCLKFHAPPLEKIEDKIYKNDEKRVKYNSIPTKCSSMIKTVEFE